MTGAHPLLGLSEEVADALHAGRPVVALESNVIAHGRTPDNAAAALQVERAVRAAGAVPATVWIDGGRIRIGMSQAQIERFATSAGIPKVSSRDLPVALARGGPGAATIAACLEAADLAGIAFVASAGLGGVHRGAQTTMDVSSDLIQLTRSKVAVVCAGAKSILDLRLTMEYLETQCVPLISFRFDDFPAFYCRSSGIRSPHRLDGEDQVARAVAAHWALGRRSAVLITAPVREQDAVPAADVEAAITEAVRRAEADGVHGHGLTKYLMAAVDEATGGRTAEANLAVLVSTAETGGRLAAAYAAL